MQQIVVLKHNSKKKELFFINNIPSTYRLDSHPKKWKKQNKRFQKGGTYS
jgi:hypothetical protein